jgi:uncharacterized protein YlxP (DUF503 family)
MIPQARSLKDKRSVVHRRKDFLRSRFNASVTEVNFQGMWQRATIAVYIVDDDKRQLESAMTRVRPLAEETQDVQITGIHQEWL